jgi:hypothetical protein
VEVEEGPGVSDSPKVATTLVTGVGRRGQATATANQIARGFDERERERERASGAGLGRLTNPDPSRLA